MIGDHEDLIDEADEFEDELTEIEPDTIADIKTANVGETSVELDVDELIAELEADCGVTSECKSSDPRKRLESILEERKAAKERQEIDDFAYDTIDEYS